MSADGYIIIGDNLHTGARNINWKLRGREHGQSSRNIKPLMTRSSLTHFILHNVWSTKKVNVLS